MKKVIYYTTDNEQDAIDEIKGFFEKNTKGKIEVLSIDVVNSSRSLKNAYGKELSEEEFEESQQEEETMWFDDQNFEIEVELQTKLTSEEINDLIYNSGFDFDEEQ